MLGDDWLIAGGVGDLLGVSDPIMLNSTEILGSQGVFVAGPDLPISVHSHCMTAINETHAFLTGGTYQKPNGDSRYNRDSFIYSSLTQEWILFSSSGKEEKNKNYKNSDYSLTSRAPTEVKINPCSKILYIVVPQALISRTRRAS